MSIFSNLFRSGSKAGSKTQKRMIGDIGEDAACKYLTEHGYDVIARNEQVSHKEIDIVAENDDYTVIVEVKTLSVKRTYAETVGKRASEQIDREKTKNLLYAAKTWCNRNYSGRTPRIDVIEVYLGDDPPSIVHIENAINESTLYRKRR